MFYDSCCFGGILKYLPISSKKPIRLQNTWGINNKHRVTLYKAVIRPSITYASEIWADKILSTEKKRLQSLQRIILTRAICGYRTLSTEIVDLLSRTPPIIPYILTKQHKYQICYPKKLTNTSFISYLPKSAKFDSPTFNYSILNISIHKKPSRFLRRLIEC